MIASNENKKKSRSPAIPAGAIIHVIEAEADEL